MVWNTKPGKREILLSNDTSSQTFILSGSPHESQRSNLPRVSLGSSGVTDSMVIDRIHKAKVAEFQLRALRVSVDLVVIFGDLGIVTCHANLVRADFASSEARGLM